MPPLNAGADCSLAAHYRNCDALALAITGFLLRGKLFAPSAKTPTARGGLAGHSAFSQRVRRSQYRLAGPSLADMLTRMWANPRVCVPSLRPPSSVLSDLHVTPELDRSDHDCRIATFSNADMMVWGQFAKFGGQTASTPRARLEARSPRPIKIEGVDEKDIPARSTAWRLRSATISRSSPDVVNDSRLAPSSHLQIHSRAPRFQSGCALLREGKNMEAIKVLQPPFRRTRSLPWPYSRLAEADSALGYDTQAEQSSRKALELSQQLPLAERYLIEATTRTS